MQRARERGHATLQQAMNRHRQKAAMLRRASLWILTRLHLTKAAVLDCTYLAPQCGRKRIEVILGGCG